MGISVKLSALHPRYLATHRDRVLAARTIRTADAVIALPFADERSVVQTRFPTSVLLLVRTVLGEDPQRALYDGAVAQQMALPVDPSRFAHFVFLGRGWTVGLAHEAALKIRESAQAWSESFPALDYRHGPIAVAADQTLVTSLGGVDPLLAADITA